MAAPILDISNIGSELDMRIFPKRVAILPVTRPSRTTPALPAREEVGLEGVVEGGGVKPSRDRLSGVSMEGIAWSAAKLAEASCSDWPEG